MEEVPGRRASLPFRTHPRLIRTPRLIRLQHGFKAHTGHWARLFNGKQRQLPPNGDLFGAVRALSEMSFHGAMLLRAQAPLQVVRQKFGDLFTLHGDLLEEEGFTAAAVPACFSAPPFAS